MAGVTVVSARTMILRYCCSTNHLTASRLVIIIDISPCYQPRLLYLSSYTRSWLPLLTCYVYMHNLNVISKCNSKSVKGYEAKWLYSIFVWLEGNFQRLRSSGWWKEPGHHPRHYRHLCLTLCTLAGVPAPPLYRRAHTDPVAHRQWTATALLLAGGPWHEKK